ncbi:PAS domain-containing protein [Sphingomonas crocodyli]|uniref:PAS domain S-box protein n=1 Tax=Sphingomonas crocodyli TaxID=1979270 RepID=A0A437LYK9_9SPHN|nr:PAS domain-containing protein [Sphingomonas crocodyli]RVT90462.1 PAS domain S-box protein [Sphingomonas crocodyli]
MPQPFWTLVDLDGRFADIDPAFCGLLGRSRESLISKSILAITHPDDKADTAADFVRSKGDVSFAIVKRYVGATGEVVWAHALATPYRSVSGRRHMLGSIWLTGPDLAIMRQRSRTSAIFQTFERWPTGTI